MGWTVLVLLLLNVLLAIRVFSLDNMRKAARDEELSNRQRERQEEELRERREKIQQEEYEERISLLERQVREGEDAAKRLEQLRQSVWQPVNRIHLYASLSAEEARTQELEEKQKEILQACEEILELIRPEEEMS